MHQGSWRRFLAAGVLAGVALLAPRIARAQTGKISGTVTDSRSGQPIEGVQVRVAGTGYGAMTQANGRYFIISVPPGTYTVQARRIGYQSTDVTNVNVSIDITRTQDFKLAPATTQLQAQTITAAAETPLVERGVTGSSTTITADEINALPVTSIEGVLSLQQGFTPVPQNTGLQSLNEQNRSTSAAIRVRGSRGGTTLSLIDGIPVNSPIFGTNAVTLNSSAVSATTFDRGYFDPQYGNALAAVINNAVREGTDQIQGNIDFRNSALAGSLGSDPDRASSYNLLRGFLAGPIPGTSAKVRYSVSGQIETQANRVLTYDNAVYSFNKPQTFVTLPPYQLDLLPGTQGFGGNQNQQLVGKLTFLPTSSSKINALAIDERRQTVPYSRSNLPIFIGDPLSVATSLADSIGLLNFRANRDLTQSSVRSAGKLYSVYGEQRLGRTTIALRAAHTEANRNTCNYYLGICVPQPFTRGNFADQFVAAFGVSGVPFTGTGLSYGGEKYSTNLFRADVQSQVADNHNILVGGSFTQNDVRYNELRGSGGNSGLVPADQVFHQSYRAKPIEAAGYVQDRIEYDFLTIKIGARYDYGLAKGSGLTNPLDPTNGTTVREVCDGTAPGISGAPLTTTGANGETLSGFLDACRFNTTTAPHSALYDSAASMARRDDYSEAKARTAFSPRIGVSFPLSERSSVFFNAGRYTKNPFYQYLYTGTGVGTIAGDASQGGDGFCSSTDVKPGTTECQPPFSRANNPDFVGNPNLRLEQATDYEVGYAAEFARSYSINVALYNRDESGLSGVKQVAATNDNAGAYQYTNVFGIVNQDFLTSRGIEIQFRRRLTNRWGYDINYGYSHTTTNSPPPDRSLEAQNGGEVDPTALRELIADIDQPHRFNAVLRYGVRNDVPHFAGASLLRNVSASLAYRFVSGFPYTPNAAQTLGGIQGGGSVKDINSGRAPSTQNVDMNLQKNFVLTNVTYGAFVQVSNLLNRRNCIQVFINTGNCENGLRDFQNRRTGNTTETYSTTFDQPEYIDSPRSILTGVNIKF
jgi:TonB dependent receptor/Carboxypeptidase regulatory-like domain/TonB-dependent Receptor Plug Domain